MEKANYLELYSAFAEATHQKIAEKTGYKYAMHIIIMVYFIISLVGLVFFLNYSSAIIIASAIAMFGIEYYIFFHKIPQKFEKMYNLPNKSFLDDNRLYWRAERALLFFENVKNRKIDFNPQETLRLIEEEKKDKKFNFFEMPFMIFFGGFLLALAKTIFEKLDLQWLIVISIVSVLIVFTYRSILIINRTEESKLNDFKIFLRWYDDFGKNITIKKIEG